MFGIVKFAEMILVLAALGALPYGIWLVWTRRKRRLRWFIAGPLLGYAILYGLTALGNSHLRLLHRRECFGAWEDPGKPIHLYASERSFQGDGYSFAVYPLPGVIRQRFTKADDSFLLSHPKLPDYRRDWTAEHWREGPVDPRFRAQVDMALYDPANQRKEDPALASYQESMRKALARKGAYHAFFHYTRGGTLMNVDFFVVDLVEDRLYIINLNT